MTKKIALTMAVSLVAAFSSACLEFEHKNTLGPTASGISGLAGVWTSGNVIPSPSTCTNFKWEPTQQTATSASGKFSATCAGQLQLNGTAQGTLTGSTISWSATGTAAASDLPSCAITLTGTAELTVDSIRVPYSGDTCLGKVSGVENLQRR